MANLDFRMYGTHANNFDLQSYEYAKVVFEVADEIWKISKKFKKIEAVTKRFKDRITSKNFEIPLNRHALDLLNTFNRKNSYTCESKRMSEEESRKKMVKYNDYTCQRIVSLYQHCLLYTSDAADE